MKEPRSNNNILLVIFFLITALFVCCQHGEKNTNRKDSPITDSSDINKAKRFYEFNDYNSCLAILKQIINTQKDHIEAYLLYQDVLLDQDRYINLINEFRSKVQKNPHDFLVLLLYARLLMKDVSLEAEAERYLKKSLGINQYFPWTYLLLAHLYFRKSQINEASKILSECNQKFPDFEPCILASASCNLHLFGLEKTIRFLEAHQSSLPENLNINLGLIDLYYKKNQLSKAESLLKKLEILYKNDFRYHRIIFARANCTKSIKTRKSLLEFYWNNYPNSVYILSVFSSLVEIYRRFSDKRAIMFVKSALKYQTTIPKLKSDVYQCLIDIYKKYDNEIFNISDEMIRSDFSDPSILIQIGKILLEKGSADRAVRIFEKAINCCEWKHIKNTIFLGPVIREQDKINVTTEFLNTSHFYLAKSYFKARRYNEAIEAYKKIIAPDNIMGEESSIDMAKCYCFLNKNNEAMEILAKSYYKYSSPKILDILQKILEKEYEGRCSLETYLSYFSKRPDQKDSVEKIAFLSEQRNKILVFTLQRSSCYACDEIMEVLSRLEKYYEGVNDIVFINLYDNERNNKIKSNIEHRDLYLRIARELNVPGVPYMLIIDRNSKIRFKMYGYEKNDSLFDNLKSRIDLLLDEK